MKQDDFEKQLQQPAPRTIPATWRSEILDSARLSSSPRHLVPAPRPAWWREWLWPHPQAWGAVTAAWIVILVIYSDTPGTSGVDREKQPAIQSQTMIAFAEQRKLLSQVLDLSFNFIAEPPKIFVPRRRSDKRDEFLVG